MGAVGSKIMGKAGSKRSSISGGALGGLGGSKKGVPGKRDEVELLPKETKPDRRRRLGYQRWQNTKNKEPEK